MTKLTKFSLNSNNSLEPVTKFMDQWKEF